MAEQNLAKIDWPSGFMPGFGEAGTEMFTVVPSKYQLTISADLLPPDPGFQRDFTMTTERIRQKLEQDALDAMSHRFIYCDNFWSDLNGQR